MKSSNLRRDALGICLAVVVLSGCGGSQSPSMSLAPQIAAPQSAAAGSALLVGAQPRRVNGIHIYPQRPTIQLGQSVTLHDFFHFCGFVCFGGREDAAWSSSGGSLQVIHNGKKAIFSASSPGEYTVVATYDTFTASDTVTVTPP